MSAMPNPMHSDFPAGLPIRGAMDSSTNPDLEEDPFASEHAQLERAAKRRRSSSFLSLLVMFCLGVAATAAWYSFGGPARQAIAGMSPQLAWMAPQQVPAPPPVPADPAVPAGPSIDQQLSTATVDIDAVKQNVDRIATAQDKILHSIDQLSAGQDLLTKEIAKLQAVEQYILYKNSEPPAPRAPSPAPHRAAAPMPLSPQAQPAR